MVGHCRQIFQERTASYDISASKSSTEGCAHHAQPMRVIGGIARGRRIQAPHGRRTRPTSDYLREVLFDLLTQQVRGSTFLDLYAGTGAVGIEALSRGAARAVFVENDRPALAMLRRNLEASGFLERGEVIPMDVLRFLRRAASGLPAFDLIFLDPPYQRVEATPALSLIASTELLAPNGIAILERSTRSDPLPTPEGLARVREVRHGDSILQLFRREGM
jgi:16S rRNA (guanine966-N2)-methyltransferase